MAQQHINYGAAPNDGTGDTLRVSQIKAESNFTELYTNKVDKVVGYGLSENNFSDADKDKLDNLVGGVQADWDQGDAMQPDYVNNKPTNVSDFTNDEGYIQDVAVAGVFARSVGAWVAIPASYAPGVLDGIAGVTSGFTVGQTVYALPAGAKCVDVYLAHTKQYKITANNGTLVNKWSQTGDNVTLTKASVLNNYVYIEYIL